MQFFDSESYKCMHQTYVSTGYVSTLADESQSILASFDKLSLTTDVEEREETARQIILKRCGQTAPLLFDDCYSQRYVVSILFCRFFLKIFCLFC